LRGRGPSPKTKKKRRQGGNKKGKAAVGKYTKKRPSSPLRKESLSSKPTVFNGVKKPRGVLLFSEKKPTEKEGGQARDPKCGKKRRSSQGEGNRHKEPHGRRKRVLERKKRFSFRSRSTEKRKHGQGCRGGVGKKGGSLLTRSEKAEKRGEDPIPVEASTQWEGCGAKIKRKGKKTCRKGGPFNKEKDSELRSRGQYKLYTAKNFPGERKEGLTFTQNCEASGTSCEKTMQEKNKNWLKGERILRKALVEKNKKQISPPVKWEEEGGPRKKSL